MRLLSLSVPSPTLFSLLVLGLLSYASPALAAWGEAWGAMVWGFPVAVPTLTGVGLIVLALAFSASAAWTLRKRRGALGLPVLLVLLAVPLVVAAGTVTVPNTFVNGTPADANQVNANFEAVETAVNDNDSRITTLQGVAADAVVTADVAEAAAVAAQSTAAAAAAGHTVNTNTQLTNTQVKIAAIAEGFVTGAHTTLDEAAVDAFVANNGFGLASDIAVLEAQIVALQAELELAGFIPRFKDCTDGLTVADRATGLLWERKTGTPGGFVSCTSSAVCPDAHDVNNIYTWSSTLGGTAADGTAYTVFLATLNTAPGFAGRTDWRLPIISELQSILIGPGVTTVANADPPDPASGTNPTGQATTCSGPPCIDPVFPAFGGPTASASYWSDSSRFDNPARAWLISHLFTNFTPNIASSPKGSDNFVRAVRAGSCGS